MPYHHCSKCHDLCFTNLTHVFSLSELQSIPGKLRYIKRKDFLFLHFSWIDEARCRLRCCWSWNIPPFHRIPKSHHFNGFKIFHIAVNAKRYGVLTAKEKLSVTIWNEKCKARGGRLASINSAAELQAAVATLKLSNWRMAHIGVFRSANDLRKFVDMDGKPITFTWVLKISKNIIDFELTFRSTRHFYALGIIEVRHVTWQ